MPLCRAIVCPSDEDADNGDSVHCALVYATLSVFSLYLCGSKNLRCPDDQNSPTCMARAFVLRVAFATAIFHVSISLFTVGANDYSAPRIMVHTALWPIKMLYWVVLHLIVFFIPSVCNRCRCRFRYRYRKVGQLVLYFSC